jgi:hypothetical protein
LEEEVLMQNIQSLILTSSRKKYINTDAGGDKLISLDNEKKQLMHDSDKLSALKINQNKSKATTSNVIR